LNYGHETVKGNTQNARHRQGLELSSFEFEKTRVFRLVFLAAVFPWLAVIQWLIVASADAQILLDVNHTQALANDLNADGKANVGDTIEYTLDIHNTGDSNAQNLTVNISPDANTSLVPGSLNVHPLAAPDLLTMNEDTPSVGGNLLSNDAGQDSGEVLRITTVNGSSTPGSVSGSYGTLVWAADGTVTYLLNTSLPAVQGLSAFDLVFEEFTYTIDDGSGFPDSSTLEIDISGVNDAPQVTNDSYQAFNNDMLTVDAAHGVLANDQDPEGQSLFISGSDGMTTAGNAVSVGTDGSFIYSGSLTTGQVDSFNYTVSDGNGGTASATAAVTGIGRIFYVDNTASYTGDGSAASPYSNIYDALASPEDNDTIYVFRGDGTSFGLDGSYNIASNNMQILGQGTALVLNGMTLISAGMPPMLSISGQPSFIVSNFNFTLRGVMIDGMNSSDSIGVQFSSSSGSRTLTVSDCQLQNLDTGFYLQSSGTAVFNAAFTDVSAMLCGSGALYFDNSGSSQAGFVINNSSFNSSLSGIEFDSSGSATCSLSLTGSHASSNMGAGFSLITGNMSSATADFTGSNQISGNSEGLSLLQMDTSTIKVNVLPTNGSNSITGNNTGVCNNGGLATVNVNPLSQSTGNSTANFSNGPCGS
jgi:uncharacterized repeat protein (TIGR01451 family)